MKGYKGFNEDMTCRGFQYEEGKEYTTDKAELCNSGFHACEHPLNCFDYYAPSQSVYHEVELGEVSDERGRDTKVCGKRIRIGAAIDIKGLIKAAFEYTVERCTNSDTGGYMSALTGGDMSALTGGYKSALTGGYRSALTGGYRSALTGGDRSALTGGYMSALTGGDRSALRGGESSKFKGGMWSVFACEIWEDGIIKGVATAVVDGETIKPDTWYKLENGEFVEAE